MLVCMYRWMPFLTTQTQFYPCRKLVMTKYPLKEAKNVSFLTSFLSTHKKRSYLIIFKCWQQWGFLQLANQCKKLPLAEMYSAKGRVEHHFINHLISMRNVILNQYSGVFSYTLVVWLELCKTIDVCARTCVLLLLCEAPRTEGSFFYFFF